MDAEPLERRVNSVFEIYETERNGDSIKFYGIPRAPTVEIRAELEPYLRNNGYKLRLGTEYGERFLVAEPRSQGFPWKNLVLAVLTLATTVLAGVFWYPIDPINQPLSLLRAWPFAVSVMGVLGAHEFGHYVMSRYHGVDASLPYFIPFPSPIGTMGAVIRIRGVIPSRKALFDIGVAGPVLGLVATVVVTAIGLSLPPVQSGAASGGTAWQFHFPPLYHLIEALVGAPAGVETEGLNPNPVVMGGWVGMFVTFLNLLPAGQLDGGHIVRSVFGDYARLVTYAVPGTLFALGVYVEFVLDSTGMVWFFWGLLTLMVASMGSAHPLNDESLGWKRTAVAAAVFLVGALCFVAVPVSVQAA